MPRKKNARGRIRFPGIAASAFQHTSDRETMKKLARLPGMQILLRRISGGYFEKSVRLLNISQNVKVGPRQCKRIYNLFREACDVLDIKEIPEIYLTTGYQPNAFSFGIDRYTVILMTGLVDLLEEEELLFTIAHELTHIKCNHMMYNTLLYILTFLGVEVFGVLFKVAAVTFFPLEMALRSWQRKAELTCDRGGLLVAQNRDVVQRAMMKMAGASKSVLPEINVQEMLRQADELKNMDEELLIRAMKMYQTAFRTHPFTVIRMKELHNWSDSDQYKRILTGNYHRA